MAVLCYSPADEDTFAADRERGGPNVEALIQHVQSNCRDNARSPMQVGSTAHTIQLAVKTNVSNDFLSLVG